jgi:hypothetical protein
MLRWVLAIITGGAAAGTIQAGTGLLRLFSTKTTGGIENSIVATSENAMAVTGSVLSLIFPVILGGLMLALLLWIVFKVRKRFEMNNK